MPGPHNDEWREEIARDGDPHSVLDQPPGAPALPLLAAPAAAPAAPSKVPTLIAAGGLALLLAWMAYKRGR